MPRRRPRVAGAGNGGAGERGRAGRAPHRAADADQPRLRMVHRGRRQPERRGGGGVSPAGRERVVAGAAPAAPPGRADLRGQPVRRRRAQHVRRQHPRPRSRHGVRGAVRDDRSRRRDRRGRQDRDGTDARRAGAVRRGEGVPRLSPRLRGDEDRAVVRGADMRVQLLVRRRGLRDGGASAGARRRHPPRARRPLPLQPPGVRRRQPRLPLRGHVLPDGRRHARAADRHQGGGRRRGRLRRQRQLRPVQRHGGRLHLLRGHHVPQHRVRHLGRPAVHRGGQGAHGQALPFRGRRGRRLHELLGVEQLLHRRQPVPRPERPGADDRLERRAALGALRRRRRAGPSPRSWRPTWR